jgi:hypothetical protein
MEIDSLGPLCRYITTHQASAARMYTKSVFRYKLLAEHFVVFLRQMLVDRGAFSAKEA